MKPHRVHSILAAFTLLSGTIFGQAHFTIIHDFAGGPNDGATPYYGPLAISGSTLFGMTYSGGVDGVGIVFRVNADGSGFTLLHSFSGGSADGAYPYGAVAVSGATLYGMTSQGGADKLGTIFKVNADGTGFALLHSFAGGAAGGAKPLGSVTISGTSLYGMTSQGGANGLGVVFAINTDGSGFTLLHSFDGYSNPPGSGGASPGGSLVLVGSTLFGMAEGWPYSSGGYAVFRMNTDGTGFAVISGGGLATPQGNYSVTLAAATLYGFIPPYEPPSVAGELWKVNADGTGAENVYAFGPMVYPMGAPVVTTDGMIIYGTATGGSTGSVVFQVNADGTGYTVLKNLTGKPGAGFPSASLVLSQSTIFGMTQDGGKYGDGCIFALTPNTPWVNTQPSGQTATVGSDVSFTVGATGPTPITYQWQRLSAGSGSWTSLSEGGAYSGTTTATLTVSSVTAAMNGDQFRCIATNNNGYDTSSPAVLVVPTPLTVSTLAGQGGHSGGNDGAGSAAQFYGPTDVAVDGAGNVYVADTGNDTIRKVTPSGSVSTLAGYPGTSGSADGSATVARFNHPSGVAADSAGTIYVADTDNDTVRKITAAGIVSTLAGMAGMTGSTDGAGSAARFNSPSGIVAGATGNLYVADTLNHTIREIGASGAVSTLAGTAGASGDADATGTAARFFGPQGLALDTAGNLFVADTNNCAIRKVVLSTGVVSTVAGSAPGRMDGPGTAAQFEFPSAVAVDSSGTLFVADTENDTIRAISPVSAVSTIAGIAGTAGNADGIGSGAKFDHPTGITVDGTGNIYIADTDNDTIRMGYFPAAPTITTQPQSQTVTVGTNVQFSVIVSGNPALTYQWYFNGTAISGATNTSLSVTNIQTSNAGDYTVTATNSLGTATSNKATLTVNAPPPPSSGGGGGGGGATEPWFVAALTALALAQILARGTVSRPQQEIRMVLK